MPVYLLTLYLLSALLILLIRHNRRCNQILPCLSLLLRPDSGLCKQISLAEVVEGGGGEGCFWLDSCHQWGAAATSLLSPYTLESWHQLLLPLPSLKS